MLITSWITTLGGTKRMAVIRGSASRITRPSERVTIFCLFRRIWPYLLPAAPAFRFQSSDPFTCGCTRMGTVAAGDIVTLYYGIPMTIIAALPALKDFWESAGQMADLTRVHFRSPGTLQRSS